MKIIELIQGLSDLQDSYSLEKRNLITIDKYQDLLQAGLVSVNDYNNTILQETLIEHVGHLPILATYLHPYIEHSAEVDLGKVLLMLAIHDIGETVVGDVYTYHKTAEEDEKERVEALKLIHPQQIDIYNEYEERKTLESLFAKSIDALAPFIHAISLSKLTLDHASLHQVDVDLVEKNKLKYFQWDSVMKEIFEICVEHYRKIERNEEGLFKQKI